MSKSNTGRAFLRVALFTSLVALAIVSCNRGDTDGGAGNNDAGTGLQLVSDGGFGATLRIEAPDNMDVGEIDGFRVRLTDPAGQPLPFIRIFCETEQGIAIIEPSRNGVAFEFTDADGQMSGKVGGLAGGSYLMECRAEEGFNLVDRVTIIIEGDAPDGFTGFPGAAGGNLGGGRFEEEPDPVPTVAPPGQGSPSITSIVFSDVNGNSSEAGVIDITFNPNCDGDPLTADPEPFGPDTVSVTINNPLEEPINIGTLTFQPGDGSGVTSVIQPSGTQIAAGSSQTFISFLTQAGPPKRWAGTAAAVGAGTFGITFSTTATGAETGTVFGLNDAATVQADGFDNCGG